ncbi:MAG: hypothetical protein ACO3SO_05650 [Luteolibacter sp.]
MKKQIPSIDANRDGKLSADELEDATDALLELDKDGDGELSPQELHPPARHRRHRAKDRRTADPNETCLFPLRSSTAGAEFFTQ